MRSAALIVVLLLGLLARVPWLTRTPDAVERAHAGAARHLVIHGTSEAPPLRLDPPAASHLGSPILWTLRSPSPEWDPSGPRDQLGWLALRDTSLPTEEFVPTWVMIAAMRAPFVLLHLVALFLIFKLAERFYGPAAGALAAGIVAVAAGPALTGAGATPAALAVPAIALLLAALDDYVQALAYIGPPPPWLLKKRTMALALACGLAAAVSFALLPVVLVAVVWMLGRRGAMDARGESCQPPSLLRRGFSIAVACAVVWALYRADVGHFDAADMTLPAPLWWAGLVDAVRDAAAVDTGARLATLRSLGSPTLLAVGALAVLGWSVLRRDRTDTPAMLGVLGVTTLALVPVLAPRHAPVALAAALPPLAMLASAWVVRLGRHARVTCAAATALLLVGLAAEWNDRRPWVPDDVLGAPAVSETATGSGASGTQETAAASALTADESWLLDRWIESRRVPRVVTVLGRKEALRVTGSSRIEEIAPGDDERVRAAVEDLDAAAHSGSDAADVAIVVGDWLHPEARLPSLAGREPDARFLRLAVYGRR